MVGWRTGGRRAPLGGNGASSTEARPVPMKAGACTPAEIGLMLSISSSHIPPRCSASDSTPAAASTQTRIRRRGACRISASNGGQFVAGDVVWNVGNLNPREERALQLSTRGRDLTEAAVQNVTATADPGLRKDAQAALKIFGLPALKVEITDQGDPAEVGKKVIYTLKVTNQGTLPAKDIDVRATIPMEMRLSDAKAFAPVDVQGQVVSFPKVDSLEVGQTKEFTIEVDTIKAGDVRFRMEVRSPILESGPIIEEESTRIYDPRQPNPTIIPVPGAALPPGQPPVPLPPPPG